MADRGDNNEGPGRNQDADSPIQLPAADDSSSEESEPTSTSVKETTSSTRSPTSTSSTETSSPTTSSSSSDDEDMSTSSPTSTARESTTSSSASESEDASSTSDSSESSDSAEESSTSASTSSSSAGSSSEASSSTLSISSASSSDASSSSFTTVTRSASASDSSVDAITATIDSPSASSSSDDAGGTVLSTGAIIGVAIGGVVALCLLLAILGRGRYFITKWTKRSHRNSHVASLALTPSPRSSMHQTNESYATIADTSRGARQPIDFSPTPLYPVQNTYAQRSNSSLHSRRSSAKGLDFDTYHPQSNPVAQFQPAYPPMPHHPYRQHTFSEFGRGSGISMAYAPSVPSQPWLEEDRRGSGSAGSVSSGAPMLPIPREVKRSSSMPVAYSRPNSDAWTSVPIVSAPSGAFSPPAPASPRVGTPSMVANPIESRASMRASVYDALNRPSARASMVDPNMMPHAQ